MIGRNRMSMLGGQQTESHQMSIQQAHMAELMTRLAPSEGYTESLLEGVTFMRSNRPLVHTQALYEPSILIVIQGRKRGFHGGNLYVYDARHYLVLSVPLPFTTETEASEAEPMLGLALRIDPTTCRAGDRHR